METSASNSLTHLTSFLDKCQSFSQSVRVNSSEDDLIPLLLQIDLVDQLISFLNAVGASLSEDDVKQINDLVQILSEIQNILTLLYHEKSSELFRSQILVALSDWLIPNCSFSRGKTETVSIVFIFFIFIG